MQSFNFKNVVFIKQNKKNLKVNLLELFFRWMEQVLVCVYGSLRGISLS